MPGWAGAYFTRAMQTCRSCNTPITAPTWDRDNTHHTHRPTIVWASLHPHPEPAEPVVAAVMVIGTGYVVRTARPGPTRVASIGPSMIHRIRMSARSGPTPDQALLFAAGLKAEPHRTAALSPSGATASRPGGADWSRPSQLCGYPARVVAPVLISEGPDSLVVAFGECGAPGLAHAGNDCQCAPGQSASGQFGSGAVLE